MNQKELRELIEFLKEQDIAEFELERGDVKVRIKRAVPGATVSMDPRPIHVVSTAVPEATTRLAGEAAAQVASVPAAAITQPPPEEKLHIVKSPIVGTFYESPSPGAPPFVKAGDIVEVGQLLCI